MADSFVDVWLPLGIALIGVGGTIAVTVVQLRARRAELDDDRAERERVEAKRAREAIAFAVHEAVGHLVSAAWVPLPDRDPASIPASPHVTRVAALMRVHLSANEAAPLVEWWNARCLQFASSYGRDAGRVELAATADIIAWHEQSATAAELLRRSKILPDLPVRQ